MHLSYPTLLRSPLVYDEQKNVADFIQFTMTKEQV